MSNTRGILVTMLISMVIILGLCAYGYVHTSSLQSKITTLDKKVTDKEKKLADLTVANEKLQTQVGESEILIASLQEKAKKEQDLKRQADTLATELSLKLRESKNAESAARTALQRYRAENHNSILDADVPDDLVDMVNGVRK